MKGSGRKIIGGEKQQNRSGKDICGNRIGQIETVAEQNRRE
jgi:hypothetical protein